MFGGLAICSLEAVVGKDDAEHIIEVNDCAMTLMGDTAHEDRDIIADLVIKQMEVVKLLYRHITLHIFTENMCLLYE